MTNQGKQSKVRQKKTKDRVLQARIPEDLDEELRDRAGQLGLSVSTVVRNVLLHTFNLVEDVVSDSTQIARVIQGRGVPPATPTGPTPEPIDTETAIVGWQQATLNRNGVCDQCNTILSKGQTAAVGIPTQARPVLLCLPCMEKLTSSDTTGDEL